MSKFVFGSTKGRSQSLGDTRSFTGGKKFVKKPLTGKSAAIEKTLHLELQEPVFDQRVMWQAMWSKTIWNIGAWHRLLRPNC